MWIWRGDAVVWTEWQMDGGDSFGIVAGWSDGEQKLTLAAHCDVGLLEGIGIKESHSSSMSPFLIIFFRGTIQR